MWLFTQHGFFSVVRNSDDTSKLFVRARLFGDLQALCASVPDLLRDAEILHWPARDYAYRIIISEGVWLALAMRLAGEVDYTNFKNAAHDARPESYDYHALLSRVWGVGADAQRRQQNGEWLHDDESL